MPYMSQVPVVEHVVVDAPKFVNTGLGVLAQELTVPLLFNKQTIDRFKGRSGNRMSYAVPGVLPWREYALRNDRTDPIIFDSIVEATVDMTVGDRVYSATRITDEQFDFDEVSPQYLAPIQGQAVANGINHKAANFLSTVDYPVVIGNAEADPFHALVEARRVLNAFHVPQQGRTLLVDPDFETVLTLSDRIALAQNVGSAVAETALKEATVGRVAGFNIVVDQNLPSGTAIAFASDSFTLFTGAPYVPASAGVGATASYGGFSLRWVRDYELTRAMDQSLMDTYLGFALAQDFLQKYDATDHLVKTTAEPHFLRAIGLKLTGANEVNDQEVLDFTDTKLATIGSKVNTTP